MTKALTAAALLTAFLSATAFANDKYDVKVTSPSVKPGEKATATVVITPKGGYHMNLEYPAKLVLNPPAGVTIEKPTMLKKDAKRIEEKGAQFDVAYTVAAAGKKSVTGEVKFAVCTSTDCQPQTEKVAFDVEAK